MPAWWLAGILLLAAGCASAPPKGSPVYYNRAPEETPRSVFTAAEDTLILARIKSKLFSDDLVDQDDIDIRVRHGVVILEGNARDIYHRRMIMDLIQTVDGVVRIENRMALIHSGTTFATSESVTRDRIQMALLGDPELGPYPVRVTATRDEVILTGSVGSQVLKQKAAAIAKGFAGDRRVVNQLVSSN
ncbi:MAG: BON domain-containing protein [Desulfobacter sp.]|nr:MAG: BON domain-containing protein [Desulfobacter sp.]